jgi:hypothetical protein
MILRPPGEKTAGLFVQVVVEIDGECEYDVQSGDDVEKGT